MNKITVIFFSCRRLDLLYRSVRAFNDLNTYPVEDFIIVNDSGDPAIWNELKRTYKGVRFVLNPENVGLILSIDRGYAEIRTDFLFHAEDDWCVTEPGFIEQSMAIMQSNPIIEEVWLADYNGHPLEEKIHLTNDQPLVTGYRIAKDNYQKGLNGFNNFAWHGFTTACGLKRKSDYVKVGPYSIIPWEGTIWHREQAIGERYHDLGYRSACLLEDFAINIGYGRSEYITGNEK